MHLVQLTAAASTPQESFGASFGALVGVLFALERIECCSVTCSVTTCTDLYDACVTWATFIGLHQAVHLRLSSVQQKQRS